MRGSRAQLRGRCPAQSGKRLSTYGAISSPQQDLWGIPSAAVSVGAHWEGDGRYSGLYLLDLESVLSFADSNAQRDQLFYAANIGDRFKVPIRNDLHIGILFSSKLLCYLAYSGRPCSFKLKYASTRSRKP